MKIADRDIGGELDQLHGDVQRRLGIEAERELKIESVEQEAISNVRWGDEIVTVLVHSRVPKHALPHVLGVALQHVRQRLDRYPDVRRPDGPQPDGFALLRQTLRELVLAPEAEMRLEALELDQQWEIEQRHAALKEMLREPPDDWTVPGSGGSKFMALQYARFAALHPPEMWEGLRKSFDERLPLAVESGNDVLKVIRANGWGTPGACLQSLVGARDELELRDVALIEDRRSGELL